MDDLSARIKAIRVANSLTQPEMADKLGVKKHQIVDLESGKTQLSIKLLRSVSEIFQLDLYQIVYGEENSKKSDGLNSEMVQIPEYQDVSLVAGGGGASPPDYAFAVRSRAFSRQWLQNRGLKVSNLSLVRVHGDSMHPVLNDKDLVMIDRARKQPTDGMPYAIFFDGGLYVKLIQPLGRGALKLVSINKFYDPIEVHLDKLSEHEFRIIGAVVWHAHSWV